MCNTTKLILYRGLQFLFRRMLKESRTRTLTWSCNKPTPLGRKRSKLSRRMTMISSMRSWYVLDNFLLPSYVGFIQRSFLTCCLLSRCHISHQKIGVPCFSHEDLCVRCFYYFCKLLILKDDEPLDGIRSSQRRMVYSVPFAV